MSLQNRLVIAVLGAAVLLGAVNAHAANTKLMSIQAAKEDAKRNILESVVGVKVRSESIVRDMVAERFTIDSKVNAVIKDIEIVDTVYDPDKDIAKVVARVNVGRIVNVIGRHMRYPNMVIERIGFGTSTPSNAAALQALRAATVHAYQQLAEQLVGVRIDSKTTVNNFILESDDLKATVLAAIWGARVTDYGWDKDGDAFVKMSLKASYVRDALGQHLLYDGQEFTAEGNGSSKDTFSKQEEPRSAPTKVREQSIAVPVESDSGGASAGPVN